MHIYVLYWNHIQGNTDITNLEKCILCKIKTLELSMVWSHFFRTMSLFECAKIVYIFQINKVNGVKPWIHTLSLFDGAKIMDMLRINEVYV